MSDPTTAVADFGCAKSYCSRAGHECSGSEGDRSVSPSSIAPRISACRCAHVMTSLLFADLGNSTKCSCNHPWISCIVFHVESNSVVHANCPCLVSATNARLDALQSTCPETFAFVAEQIQQLDVHTLADQWSGLHEKMIEVGCCVCRSPPGQHSCWYSRAAAVLRLRYDSRPVYIMLPSGLLQATHCMLIQCKHESCHRSIHSEGVWHPGSERVVCCGCAVIF